MMEKYIIKKRNKDTGLWENIETIKGYTISEVDDSYFFGWFKFKRKVAKSIDIKELRQTIRNKLSSLYPNDESQDVKVELYRRYTYEYEECVIRKWEYVDTIWKNGEWID